MKLFSPNSLRRALAASALMLGVGAAAAPSAHAVDRLDYCFQQQGVRVWAGSVPVTLQIWDGQRWIDLVNARSDKYGCGAFNLGGYFQYASRVVSNRSLGTGSLTGDTAWANGGRGNSSVGGVIRLIGPQMNINWSGYSAAEIQAVCRASPTLCR
jgi:hypothetical protein